MRRWYLLVLVGMTAICSTASGAITWNGNGTNVGGKWWFDPANWSQAANSLIPPSQSQTIDGTAYVVTIDSQIGNGSTVDFDPDHDPFFSAAAARSYGPGAITGPQTGAPTAFGPQAQWRLYLTRRDGTTGVNTSTNVLNIKSGSLWFINGDAALLANNPPYPNLGTASFIVGRSGGGTGKVVQTGGFFSMAENLDLGASEAATTTGTILPASSGTGFYEYRGGTVEAGLNTAATGRGIRLSAGVALAPSGAGTFIDRNEGTTGHIRVQDFVFAVSQQSTIQAVGTAEFHYVPSGGGVRPIQVNRNLSINNSATQSSRLGLVLDSAPAVDELGAPPSIGLFDVDSDANAAGQINNTTGGDSARRFFYSPLGNISYPDGSTVSSVFGLTRYNWTIHYNGNINWTDIDNSVVSNVEWISDTASRPSTHRDVVLIGSSTGSAIMHNDLNFDGMVDAFDVPEMLKALTDLNAYKAQHSIPDNATLNQIADINNDGAVNNFDIQSLLDLFTGTGSIASVPEPASCVLVMLGCCGLAVLRRRRS
jgi:hypothetical protein